MGIAIRWRFILLLSFLFLASGVVTHFVHGAQVRKQTGAFLHQADVAREAKNDDREIKYLERYLLAKPGAIEERDRLARLLARNAKTAKQYQQAYFFLEDVLRRDPNRDDLRRVTLNFAITIGLVNEAMGHLTELLKRNPNDGELEERYAQCLVYNREYEEAVRKFLWAAVHKSDLLMAYGGQALILRNQLTEPDVADAVMDEMIEFNSGNFRAHLLLTDYWRKYGKQDQIEAALAEARKLAPDELEVILVSAEVFRDGSRKARLKGDGKTAETKTDEARAELERGMKLFPKEVSIYLARASVEAEARSPKEAIAIIRVGLKEHPNQVNLLFALSDYQILSNDAEGAKTTLAELELLGATAEQLAYDRARILAVKGEWLNAAIALEAVRHNAPVDSQLARSASLILGRCYEQIGETDRRMEAFTRAIPLDIMDPLWVAGMQGQAETYSAMGRADDALKTYQKLADIASAAWLQVARLRMILTLRSQVPSESKDWKPCEEAVEIAVRVLPDNPEALILRADLLVFRNKPDEARKIIDELFEKKKTSVPVWIAKAGQQYREGSLQLAWDLLDQGRGELGDSVDLRLAQARMLSNKNETESMAKLLELAKGIEKYTSIDRRKLLRGLAEVAGFTGASDLAGQFWNQVIVQQPDDLSAHLVRFDRSLLADDDPGLIRVQGEIRRVDGERGASTRSARALYLIWRAQKKNDSTGLKEALTLLEGLDRDRPGWSRVPLGKALIHDLQNKPGAALPYYQQAVERGEYNPAVLSRLFMLLAAADRTNEANEILDKLPDLSAGGPDAQRLAAQVALKLENPKRALLHAALAVPANSTNPEDWTWLGFIRWNVNELPEAEKAFRRAIELKPENPKSWLNLVGFMLANGRRPDAESARDEALAKIPAAEQTLFLAECHAVMGRLDLAEVEYRKARAERPNDTRVLVEFAKFLTKTQKSDSILDTPAQTKAREDRAEEARNACKQVIGLSTASEEDKDIAKLILVTSHAHDTDYSSAKKAFELLGMDASGALTNPVSNELPAQRRVRAMVLAIQKARVSKQAAIRLLEIDHDILAPNDRFLLAQLYEQVGDKPSVRSTMTELLRKSEKNTGFIVYFVRWLLLQDDTQDAAVWISKLEKLAPDALATAELKIRLASAKKDQTVARNMIRKLADKPNPPWVGLAQLAESVGLLPEAEEYYRKFVDAEKAKRPEVVLVLAHYVARRDRIADALDLCDSAWANCPPALVIQISVEILATVIRRDAKDIARVKDRIELARKNIPVIETIANLQLAYIKNLEGDYPKAMEMYRTLILGKKLEREALSLALNNLAYLVSLHSGNHEEALSLVQQAKDVVGAHHEILDTEAMIRTVRGTNEDYVIARKLLEDVIALHPNGPAYFHLALLEKKVGNAAESMLAWREAQKLKLAKHELHPLEWGDLGKMQAER